MFHAFDNTGPNRPTPRPEWMALLSRAPLPLLEQALAQQAPAALQWLRKPETGLYMVQGRAGGSGERFNLGEITVTRCALRMGSQSAARAHGPTGAGESGRKVRAGSPRQGRGGAGSGRTGQALR